MAEMILAVESVHRLGYIHRDLKPDNFLIDKEGHLKLTDFGLSKEGVLIPKILASPAFDVSHKIKASSWAYSVVGSPDYMAPEVLTSSGYGNEVDWWSLGCIFFELVAGYPPFYGTSAEAVFNNVINWENVLECEIKTLEDTFSDHFKDLILRFLCEPSNRLGTKGISEIKTHPFFAGMDWKNLSSNKPFFVPRLKSDSDISYFETVSKKPSTSGDSQEKLDNHSPDLEKPNSSVGTPPNAPSTTEGGTQDKKILGFTFKRLNVRKIFDKPPTNLDKSLFFNLDLRVDF
eukprot:TRINITY_DN17158_c0_g1_i1.p1 TRINITY_DN17158_c0_g1~~TRINITY_DN17158_c0_g1_i1.p1  ORF type:complete len:327 (+),score=60.73 TRINITY_DN17158_c0_g1_i1:117-983(+)